MTIRIAPAASGVNTLPLSTATPTTKVRKNAPIASTAYFRVATAPTGERQQLLPILVGL